MSSRPTTLAKRVAGRLVRAVAPDLAAERTGRLVAEAEVARLAGELTTWKALMPDPAELGNELKPVSLVPLDYPVTPRFRFGWGLPVHAGIAADLEEARGRFEGWAQAMVARTAQLHAIPGEAQADGRIPHWHNGWLPPQDAAALYTVLAEHDPAWYIEVGSGNSTLFARRAIEDHGLRTKLVSIDPMPRAEVDGVCDEMIRQPFEDGDLTVFDRIGSGDVVFVDNSHRALPNSDVTVFMLEVLPALPPGVFVHLHDIFLPADYPPDWSDRFYSEQYLLAAMLLAGHANFDVEFPGWFVAHDDRCAAILDPLWQGTLAGQGHLAGSFWIRTT